MCEVSDKLKLCTCSPDAIETAKHYWVIHQLVKGRNMSVVGELLAPYFFDEETDLANTNLLLGLLNNGAVFDEPIHPAEGDLLELNFRPGKDKESILTYGFKYQEGKWKEEDNSVFGWMTHHEPKLQGKIKNALKRKRPGQDGDKK